MRLTSGGGLRFLLLSLLLPFPHEPHQSTPEPRKQLIPLLIPLLFRHAVHPSVVLLFHLPPQVIRLGQAIVKRLSEVEVRKLFSISRGEAGARFR